MKSAPVKNGEKFFEFLRSCIVHTLIACFANPINDRVRKRNSVTKVYGQVLRSYQSSEI